MGRYFSQSRPDSLHVLRRVQIGAAEIRERARAHAPRDWTGPHRRRRLPDNLFLHPRALGGMPCSGVSRTTYAWTWSGVPREGPDRPEEQSSAASETPKPEDRGVLPSRIANCGELPLSLVARVTFPIASADPGCRAPHAARVKAPPLPVATLGRGATQIGLQQRPPRRRQAREPPRAAPLHASGACARCRGRGAHRAACATDRPDAGRRACATDRRDGSSSAPGPARPGGDLKLLNSAFKELRHASKRVRALRGDAQGRRVRERPDAARPPRLAAGARLCRTHGRSRPGW